MQPASPYGDTITLRISNYRTGEDIQKKGNLALLCSSACQLLQASLSTLSIPEATAL